MSSMSSVSPITHARRWLHPLHALLLAALLLAAQGLGLDHHAVHGGTAQAHPVAWVDGHDDGSNDCRLIDQLGHADLAWGGPAPLPGLPLQGHAPARLAAGAWRQAPTLGYSARAPPCALALHVLSA